MGHLILWKWTGIVGSYSCNVTIFLVPRIKVFLCFWYKYLYSIIKCLTNLHGSAHWLVSFFFISDLILEDTWFFLSSFFFLSRACSQIPSWYQMYRIDFTDVALDWSLSTSLLPMICLVTQMAVAFILSSINFKALNGQNNNTKSISKVSI